MARGRPPKRPKVNLLQSLRTVKYNQELDKAFSELCDFAGVHARHGPFILQNRPTALAQLAVDYVQARFNDGSSRASATHAVLALQHRFPRCRTALKPAWDSLTAWSLLSPVRPRIPMPEGIMEALSAALKGLAALATGRKAWQFWVASFLVQLGFHALLRPGECCGLQAGHLQFGDDGEVMPEPDQRTG